MNNYFYNSEDKEYFRIISRENGFIDISVISAKSNIHSKISEDIFSRRCFSVKKVPKNVLCNKNSYTISPLNSNDNKVTFLSNSIINYDNIDESEFMISSSNSNNTNSYDIITKLNFKSTKDLVQYLSHKKIIDTKYLKHLQKFKIVNNGSKQKTKQNQQPKTIL
jgi:hypothetical protein